MILPERLKRVGQVNPVFIWNKMKVVVVHGCNDNKQEAFEGGRENTRHWHPWLKEELEKRGIEFSGELYPDDWNPDYSEWIKVFEKNKIDKETILVGHSCGGGFLLRWLGENKCRIKKLILVAPAITYGEYVNPSLVSFDLNKDCIKHVDKTVIFSSFNESKGLKKALRIICDKLEISPVLFKDKGHFTLEDMGTREFPELLEEILN